MKPDALISVVIPIYNVEPFLAQCLNSVRNQTHRNLEIICVNDGSTDGSLRIARELAADDDRFVIIDKVNEGYGASCNMGIDAARGEWISIIEPDDWIDARMYETMLAFAARFDEPVDIVKTPWIDVIDWDDEKTMREAKCSLAGRIPTSRKPFDLSRHLALIEAHPSIWSALYRRAFLNEKGIRFVPYSGAGWADNPFLVETLGQARCIVYLDEPFYHYRCELPGAKHADASVERIAMPFERWMEMARVLDRLGIKDSGVLRSHDLRGFNYAHEAMNAYGADNETVQEKTREMFAMMDEKRVLSNPKLRRSRKQLYLDMMCIDKKAPMTPKRLPYLLKETTLTLRSRGMQSIADKLKRR